MTMERRETSLRQAARQMVQGLAAALPAEETPTSPQLVAFIITQAAALCHHYINAAAPPKRTGGRKNFGILPSSLPRVYS